jgi:hypothetical protein
MEEIRRRQRVQNALHHHEGSQKQVAPDVGRLIGKAQTPLKHVLQVAVHDLRCAISSQVRLLRRPVARPPLSEEQPMAIGVGDRLYCRLVGAIRSQGQTSRLIAVKQEVTRVGLDAVFRRLGGAVVPDFKCRIENAVAFWDNL